jgi:hypothetical protein
MKIVVFGAGIFAEKFILNASAYIDIDYIVDNERWSTSLSELHGYKIYKPEKLLDAQCSDVTLLIAVENPRYYYKQRSRMQDFEMESLI